MAFSIASLADLVGRARSSFRAYLPGTDAWLWPNNVYVIAKVIGGAHAEIMGRLAYVAKQARVLTADDEWLDLWGAQYAMPRLPATLAAGTATIAAPDAVTVPAGTLLLRSDGVAYTATADVSLPGAGTIDVAVVALVAGKTALAVAGTPLTLSPSADGTARPLGPGADGATASVSGSGIAGGAEVEGDEPYRARILFRLRNPPHGGAPSDYVLWAGQVPGVTRVFVERLYAGPGTVRVFPMFDDVFAARGGLPDPAHVAAVVAAIAPVAPAGADWIASAAGRYRIDVAIAGLQPLTTAVETAIAAELADTFRRLGKVSGTDTPVPALPYLATPQTFSRSWISQAISNATGEDRHVLVAPAADIRIPPGFAPVLGTIDFAARTT